MKPSQNNKPVGARVTSACGDNFRKRNHYLAQSCLARFCDESGKLLVFDKETLAAKQLAPIDIAVEKHLYTIENAEGEKSDVLESQVFDPLDGEIVPMMDRWSKPGYRPTKDEFPVMANYIAFQHTRVPRNLALMDELGVAFLVKDMKEMAADPKVLDEIWHSMSASGTNKVGTKEELIQLLEDPEKRVKINMNREVSLAFSLRMAQTITRFISSLHWCILDAPSGSHFITCDSPAVSYAPDGKGRYQVGANFASPRFELSYPISPFTCVLLRKVPSQQRRRCSQEVVRDLNRRAACIAERYVYAQTWTKATDELVREFAYTRRQPKVNREELYRSMEQGAR